jgi:GDSL-like Lipase/Acylhydrolase family
MIKKLLLLICLSYRALDASAGYLPSDREAVEWCDIWMPHANETNASLPHVLLIGDSITRGYYSGVEKRLAGKAIVARLTTSAFVSDPMLLQQIALVLDNQKFDVIQFNNGMHGWRHSEAEYRAAFPKFLATIQQHAAGAKLIWANTTPLKGGAEADTTEPAAATDKNVEGRKLMLKSDLSGRSNARIAARNAIALEFVKPLNLPVVDLNTLMAGHPEYHNGDVHFNEQGMNVQAERVAAEVLTVLQHP